MGKKSSVLFFSLTGAALLVGLYFLLVRTNLHHTILDVVYGTFIRRNAMNESGGTYYSETYIDWPNVKLFLILFAVGVGFVVSIVSYLIYRSRLKKNTQMLAGSIAQFFADPAGMGTGELIIDNELLKIKTNIEHNEELLKRETQRTKDLITYLAHDLKTPLASVIGYLNLMIDSQDLTQAQMNHFLSITLDKSLRLENLINDFFDITRFNLQDIQLYKSELDFVLLLRQLTDEFYPLLKEKKLRLEYHGPDSLKLTADNQQLARVLNNLLKNAISYGTTDSIIQLQLEVEANSLVFSISNQGATIPQKQIDMIFEKFYRLDQSRSTKTGGAGLGLAIAKEIILAHQGTIAAVSEAGITTFHFTLPLHEENA
ncbi:vancomycin resistance histidine kinase VanS [Enterococcus florum]|uniref:histidine kinase n=1 Tax=Enterococcus florum TaxID=2480627 RepID=A0A4P5PE89_9ENTE|nr:HAMP domain-containing sensor histidine kinase [Enterococcus florum]GCF94924.1 vancomycin resistance histidine kinase VanS [Enterococcus florum]